MNQRDVLEKLTKWRSVFASWQVGTRADTDGETRAIKDHRELTILLRAEVTALTGLLLEKGVFTLEEFDDHLYREAVTLDSDYEARFPGFRTSLDGVELDLERARETMRRLGFPP